MRNRLLALVASAAAVLPAVAARAEGTAAPELRGTAWINGRDIELQRLRGKVVVLYFFEEG